MTSWLRKVNQNRKVVKLAGGSMRYLTEPIDWVTPTNPILENGAQVLEGPFDKIWTVVGRNDDGVILKRVGSSARSFFDVEKSVTWFELARDFALCSSNGQRSLLMHRHVEMSKTKRTGSPD